MATAQVRQLFTPSEIAELCELPTRKVLADIRAGELRAVFVGVRTQRIPCDDGIRYIARMRATPVRALSHLRRERRFVPLDGRGLITGLYAAWLLSVTPQHVRNLIAEGRFTRVGPTPSRRERQ